MKECWLKARTLQLLNVVEFRAWLKEKEASGKPLCEGNRYRSKSHPLSIYLREHLPPGHRVETKNARVLIYKKGCESPVIIYFGRGSKWAEWFVMDLWQRHRYNAPTARMCLNVLRYKD